MFGLYQASLKTLLPVLAAGVGLFGMAGCKPASSPVEQPATPAPPKEKAVKIGVFVPLTGAQSTFGGDALRGAQMAAEEVNAAGGVLKGPLELEVRDTRSDEATTTEVVNELTSNPEILLMVGEIASVRSILAAALAQAAEVPMISPGSTHQDVTAAGDFIFRICYAEPFQGAAMARFAESLKARKAAVLLEETNPYSRGLAESFRTNFSKAGGEVVAEQTFREGDVDFKTQLEAIKAAQPDLVFLPSYYAEAAQVIRQARELGIDTPFLGGDGWDSEEFLRVAGNAAENTYIANHFSAQNRLAQNENFITFYEARHGTPPPPLAALAYDTVKLAADAINRAGSRDRVKIREALAATSVFPGVTGTVTFDGNRNPAKPAVILRVENGKFTYLETIQP